MSILKLTVVGLVVLLFAKDDATWVINVPGAPMVIDTQGATRGAYELKNTSGKEIVSFTLGCVVLKKHKTMIILRLPQQNIPVAAGGSFDEAIIDGPYTEPYAQCVVKQKAKLSLISVVFADKTSWSFSGEPSEPGGRN